MREIFSRSHALPGVLIAIAIVLAGAMFAVNVQRATAQDSASISIVDFTFSPGSVTVDAGATVTWTNNDTTAHTATSSGVFDTGTLQPGQSGSVTLSTPGTYNYICSIHPNMTGSIVVMGAEAAPPASDDDDDDGGTGGTVQTPNTGTGTLAAGSAGGTMGVAGLGLILLMIAVAARRRIA